jgi:hypothetical protein
MTRLTRNGDVRGREIFVGKQIRARDFFVGRPCGCCDRRPEKYWGSISMALSTDVTMLSYHLCTCGIKRRWSHVLIGCPEPID